MQTGTIAELRELLFKQEKYAKSSGACPSSPRKNQRTINDVACVKGVGEDPCLWVDSALHSSRTLLPDADQDDLDLNSN